MSVQGNPQQRAFAPDFFISYTHADRERAEWIAGILERAGYSTLLQAWDFFPGSNFVIEMQKAATKARRTIAVLSPDYLNSAYATAEWAAAFALDPDSSQGRLIPVRVRACEPEGLLKAIVFIDLVDLGKDEAARTLLKGIQAGRQRPSGTPRFPLRRTISVTAVLAVLAVILGAVVDLNAVWSWLRPAAPELYRIRVTVLDSSSLPVDDANVWSSLGGEAQKVAGGWELNIPRAAAPKDETLTIFASRPAAFELGSGRLQLGREPNPSLTVKLERDLTGQTLPIFGVC
jgi:hypothetical protein